MAPKWKNIGLALGLISPQLNTISSKPDDTTGYLREMLELWLNKAGGEPSWQLLQKAVRSEAGGNNPALAGRLLHQEYAQ